MEGVGLDAQAMDDDREGSVISEDDRATSVWDGDDTRSEMMVSVFRQLNHAIYGFFGASDFSNFCVSEIRITCM